jgi:hypothetical protein
VEIQKEEIEHLHRTALDRINRYEKTVYAISLISFFYLAGLEVSLSKTITKDGVKLKLLIRKKSMAKPESLPIV